MTKQTLLTVSCELPESDMESINAVCQELSYCDSSLESRQKAIEILQKVVNGEVMSFRTQEEA